MLDKIKKFVKDRGTYYPNIEIFLYFAIKAIKKSAIRVGIIHADKNNKDMFDWPLYYLHYKGELKKDAKNYTLSLKPNDYKYGNGSLIKSNPSVKPLHYLHRFLYETILQLNPASIYEMGCGTGMHLHNLNILMPQAKICGTDLSDIQLKYLGKSYPELANKVKQSDSTVLTTETPFESCDLTFTQAVIMHIHTGESHLIALENLFKMSKKYVVLHESMKNHQFLDDIKRLHAEGRIVWEKVFYYYRMNKETGLAAGLICSKTPLDYPTLTDYRVYSKKV